ncbi:MAG: DciA family protein [Candidatus Spechtbacterales bacterium]
MWVGLGNLLNKKRELFGEKIEDAQLSSVWNDTIKNIHPKAAPYTHYKDFKKNTLYIRVEDAIWAGELEFYKENLKQSINDKRKNPVQTIKFTLGF